MFDRHLHLLLFQRGIPWLCFFGMSHPGAPTTLWADITLSVPTRPNRTWKPSRFGRELPSPCLETRPGVGGTAKELHFLEHLLLVKL